LQGRLSSLTILCLGFLVVTGVQSTSFSSFFRMSTPLDVMQGLAVSAPVLSFFSAVKNMSFKLISAYLEVGTGIKLL